MTPALLKRWIFDENAFIQHLLCIGMTLNDEEIDRPSRSFILPTSNIAGFAR
jgi:hypothetical protein